MKGFKNYHNHDSDCGCCECIAYKAGKEECLRCLKEQSIEGQNGQYIDYWDDYIKITGIFKRKCHLVFIEEEEWNTNALSVVGM